MKGELTMKRIELNTIPYDQGFETSNGWEICVATGYAVYDEATNRWWNEYVDSDGEIHLG